MQIKSQQMCEVRQVEVAVRKTEVGLSGFQDVEDEQWVRDAPRC